jgi:putative transposase
MLRGLLATEGCKVGRRHVKTLMKRMGIEDSVVVRGPRSPSRGVETLEDALALHGKLDIFNMDQGSQFTGAAFTGGLTDNGIAISMDGKGAWRDNVFVERLWRSIKYEEVYLRAYDCVSEARASIGRYLNFYNGRRPHSSLDGVTPDQAYFNSLPLRLAA